MDARREQVYTAQFDNGEWKMERAAPDRAMGTQELYRDSSRKKNPTLVGDGPNCVIISLTIQKFPPPEGFRLIRGGSVASSVRKGRERAKWSW